MGSRATMKKVFLVGGEHEGQVCSIIPNRKIPFPPPQIKLISFFNKNLTVISSYIRSTSINKPRTSSGMEVYYFDRIKIYDYCIFDKQEK
jgi:hypothetical protein